MTAPGRPDFLLHPTRPALTFAIRTTATALVALVFGMALGLRYPVWAAMTVVIVARPTRGMVLARGFYRLIGTCAGALAGTAMLVLLRDHPPLLVLALAGWVGLCAAGANVLAVPRNYGAVLAALTAALVALLAFSQPEQAFSVDTSRVTAVLLGVAVSAIMTLLFIPSSDRGALLEPARRLALDGIRAVADTLREEDAEKRRRHEKEVVADLAALDDAADELTAASRLRSAVPRVRGLMGSILSLMAAARALATHRAPENAPGTGTIHAIADLLDEAARLLERPGSCTADPTTDLRQLLSELAADDPLRVPGRDMLAAVESLLRDLDGLDSGGPKADGGGPRYRHRDWRPARITGLRAFLGISMIGALWLATGWDAGGPMLMAAAIMCAIFATHPWPASGVLGSLKGAALALACALAARLWLQPAMPHATLDLLVIGPLLLIGTLAMSNRPTAIAGTDFSMMVLFMLAPGYRPLSPQGHLLTLGTGIVAGVATIAVVFARILPLDPEKRLRSLHDLIVRDLERLCSVRDNQLARRRKARTHHRILRLVLRAGQAGRRQEIAVDGGLAAITIGNALTHLRTLTDDPELPGRARSVIADLLLRLRHLTRDPEDALAAEYRASRALSQVRYSLVEIADALAANLYFFRYTDLSATD